MEKADMEAILLEEFKNDPIYRLAILNGLEKFLFTDGILSLHKDLTYSTVDTGKIIERSDSTIRNHFRSDLIEYINPEKFGKFYRLNYQSIFRLHLIFLLMEKSQKTTVDILAELGMHPAMSMGGNLKRVPRNESRELAEVSDDSDITHIIDERFGKIEHTMNLQGLMLNILKYEKDLVEIDRKIDSNQSRIKQIASESRMSYLEEKQAQLLISSLRKSIKKPSFFGMFKKEQDIDVLEISNQIDGNIKERYDKEVKDLTSEYESEIAKLKEEKEVLIESLKKEKGMFAEYQIEYDKIKMISTPE